MISADGSERIGCTGFAAATDADRRASTAPDLVCDLQPHFLPLLGRCR